MSIRSLAGAFPLLVSTLALPGAAAAKGADPGLKPVTTVEGASQYDLPNGMRVVLLPDDSQAKVYVDVVYHVGSRHEGYGETGMAHLLEHMLFKGTPSHKEPWKDLQQHGASFNASTDYDRTEYHEVLPASDENVKFALEFEADRMINSYVAAEELAKEFSVVRNEFEKNENDPDNVLEERILSTAYLWHNYGKAVIGTRADIERVPIDNLRAFYKKYYQPDNAVLFLAGKLDVPKTLAVVQATFGKIKRPERKLGGQYTTEPVQDGARAVELLRVGDVQVVGVLYHTVAAADERYEAVAAIPFIMTDQPNGRLYRALVTTGMASRVWASAKPMQEPGWVLFFAEVPADKPLAPVRDKMIECIEALATNQPRADEVAHYRARALKNVELAATDAQHMARQLASWEVLGDWRLAFVHRDRLEKLTAEQVADAAAAFLKPQNRTVGMFMPTKQPDRSPQPGLPDVAALVKDYQGRTAVAAGETFDASIENVEKRTLRTELPVGIKLAMLPKQTRGKTVRLDLMLRYGTEKELTGHKEAAALAAALVQRGSRKYDFQKLHDELDRLKATLTLTSSAGEVGVTIVTTRENLLPVLAVAGEVLREPLFPADQFEILKKERITRLEAGLSDPQALAQVEIARRMNPYPASDFRYVPTVAEAIERNQKVTLDEVKQVYAMWGASHGEAAVVGDFDPEEVKAALGQALGSWKAPGPYQRIALPFKKVDGSLLEIDTPDKENAVIVAAVSFAMRDDDADYPALFVANFILGGSASSRLFERLRNKGGWSYHASSHLVADEEDVRGQLFALAIAAPQNADKARTALVDEVAKMFSEGPTPEELAVAKESYKKRFASQLADDAFLAAKLQRGLHLGRTLAFDKKRNDTIDKITLDEVKAVLKKGLVRAGGLVVVEAGDKKKAQQSSMR